MFTFFGYYTYKAQGKQENLYNLVFLLDFIISITNTLEFFYIATKDWMYVSL